ncbi:hypothetical protein SLEP1_g11130 [Rubroshorea leprosula]|uniref:Uncharacterized protein n=1 Tax=Rubroshorea leprosula TaxID=152421 RepID=A0AAV5IL42_9ROSI|nr:hypothetical protein SLEP1_g11130 [Rubroshorea leprosula]
MVVLPHPPLGFSGDEEEEDEDGKVMIGLPWPPLGLGLKEDEVMIGPLPAAVEFDLDELDLEEES